MTLRKRLDKISGSPYALAGVFLIALLLRTLYTVFIYQKVGFSNFVDDWDYLSYAEQIREQGITVPDITRIYGNGHQVGIGWPLIIHGIFSLFGKNYLYIFAFNVIISALHAVAVFKLGEVLFSRRVGFLAGLWSAFYVSFIKFAPSALKECLIHFSFIFCLFLLVKAIKNRKMIHVVLLGLWSAVFIHIDERYLTLLPFFALFVFIARYPDWKEAFKATGALTAIVILVMVPWLIRNYNVYKRPVLLAYQTTEFTDRFFVTDTAGLVTGPLSRPTSYDRKNLPMYEQITRDMLAGKNVDSIYGDVAYIKEMREGIAMGMIPVTYSYGKNLYEEFKEFFRPFRFHASYMANGYRLFKPRPFFNNILYILQYGLMLPFCLVGIYYVFKKRYLAGNAIICIMIVYSFVHIFLVHALERYRLPIDGLIFIIGMFGFLMLIDRLKKSSSENVKS